MDTYLCIHSLISTDASFYINARKMMGESQRVIALYFRACALREITSRGPRYLKHVPLPRTRANHQSYELCRKAQRKCHQLHHKAYIKCSGPAELWQEAVEVIVSRYSKIDDEIVVEQPCIRLDWFRRLLLDEIKRLRNLKRVPILRPSCVSY